MNKTGKPGNSTPFRWSDGGGAALVLLLLRRQRRRLAQGGAPKEAHSCLWEDSRAIDARTCGWMTVILALSSVMTNASLTSWKED